MTQVVAKEAAPEIAFPADGVDVDLGVASGRRPAADHQESATAFRRSPSLPMARRSAIPTFARQDSWTPDGPGYVTLSVVDAKGKSDAVKVFIE